jgi:hypothetical protein
VSSMKIRTGLSALAVVALLIGCATAPDIPEQTVEERAQARWDHLVARQFGQAWAYYSPGFRATTSAEDFTFDMVRRQVRWTAAEVLSSECQGDRCQVFYRVEYKPATGPTHFRDMALNRTQEESWIRSEGQWWYVQN